MKREEHVENFRFVGIIMMFFITIFAILVCYTSCEHRIAAVKMTNAEKDIEAFVIFSLVIFLSLFTFSIELFRLAERQGLLKMIVIAISTMLVLIMLMF